MHQLEIAPMAGMMAGVTHNYHHCQHHAGQDGDGDHGGKSNTVTLRAQVMSRASPDLARCSPRADGCLR
eukprot:4558309-Alexandrium_andersonii.AAC.1